MSEASCCCGGKKEEPQKIVEPISGKKNRGMGGMGGTSCACGSGCMCGSGNMSGCMCGSGCGCGGNMGGCNCMTNPGMCSCGPTCLCGTMGEMMVNMKNITINRNTDVMIDIGHIIFKNVTLNIKSNRISDLMVETIDRPAEVFRIPGVFEHYHIDMPSITANIVNNIVLEFHVPKNWYLKMNYLPEKTVLNHWVNGTWVEETAQLIGSDEMSHHFTASIPSFSYFNISSQLSPNISNPGGVPHYFGPWPNWANTPLPRGMVSDIFIEDGGAGYSNNVSVVIKDYYYGDVYHPATASATVTNGVITDIVLNTPGSGYSVPIVSIVDNQNTPITEAIISASMVPHSADQITRIEINNGGTNYTALPTINIIDNAHNGDDAVLVPEIRNGSIVNVSVKYPGTGYVNPIINVTGGNGSGAQLSAVLGGYVAGIRKFVNPLRPISKSFADNDNLNTIPLAITDTTSYPGDDFYEVAVVEFEHKFHSDLPPTRVRGYVQVVLDSVPDGVNIGSLSVLKYPDGTNITYNNRNVLGVTNPRYMGPFISTEENKTVRMKFYNLLPIGAAGKLMLPVDLTTMGAGMNEVTGEMYPENRTCVHLHGNNSVWISDGTPHQWFTPADEVTSQKKGISIHNVPDMPAPSDGAITLYFSNSQSSRLLFYHDHTYGLTRLNVYIGEVGLYNITSLIEKDLKTGNNESGHNPNFYNILPEPEYLVIQDKTFVDSDAIAFQDPTWNAGTGARDANDRITEYKTGDMWYPHVYVPAQNPASPDGLNPFGRWHYGPYFWPPAQVEHMPKENPNYDPLNPSPYEPPLIPGLPDISSAGEAFMDTMTVNGVVYPYMEVDPKVMRFKILNGSDDRFVNLQWYIADPHAKTEVKMVDAAVGNPLFPETWPIDGREGGVPDPTLNGPSFIQIGNECGFLPNPVDIPAQPITWLLDQTAFGFGNVQDHSLLLGTAERADVLVDFTGYAGKTLILYNDAPSAFPAIDNHYTYYTDCPDRMDMGGAPSTRAGYGPNIRTIMQVRVRNTTGSPIAGFEVVESGECYQNPSVELIGGGGQGAIASIHGIVNGVTITSPGSNYRMPEVVVDMTGQPIDSTPPVFKIDTYSGSIVNVDVVDGGNRLAFAPPITINDLYGLGSGAVVSCSLSIVSISLDNAGSDYTSPPFVVITDEYGHGCKVESYINSAYPPLDMDALNDVFTHTQTHNSIFELTQEPIIVPFADYNNAYGRTDLPADNYIRINQHSHDFVGLDGTPHSIYLEPKALQDEMGEVFDPYGRMMVMLGLEVPFTAPGNQNFVLYPFVSPPVDVLGANVIDLKAPGAKDLIASHLATTEDGTQFWRISHNGVDAHTIHIHLFNAQLINRIGWDNIIYPPSGSELGFKETFIIHPLQNSYFAFRPIVDKSPPFFKDIPNSVRLIDQTMPEGMPLVAPVGGWADPNGDPVLDANDVEQIVNQYVNYGLEYVYHCHLLAHEEMDMMHSVCVAIPPEPPINSVFTRTANGNNVHITISWAAGSANTTGFVIERSNDNLTWVVLTDPPLSPTTFSYVDSITGNTSPSYRIKALNLVGAVNVQNFPVVLRESIYANVEFGGPALKPTNLNATTTAISSNISMTITWVNGAYTKSLLLQISLNPNFSQIVGTYNINSPLTSYTVISGLLQATRYYYRLEAYNGPIGVNGSGFTNSSNITTQLYLPPSTQIVNTIQQNNPYATLSGTNNNRSLTITFTDNSLWPNGTTHTLQYSTDNRFSNGNTTTVNNNNIVSLGNNQYRVVITVGRNAAQAYYVRFRGSLNGVTSAWVVSNT